jgi:hypothetical protein
MRARILPQLLLLQAMTMPSSDTLSHAHTNTPIHFATLAPRELLGQLYGAAVRQALPAHTLSHYLPSLPKGRTLVLGAGKAGGAMAHALDALWPQDQPLSGLVVTRYGHTPQRRRRAASRWWKRPIRCLTLPGWRRPSASLP